MLNLLTRDFLKRSTALATLPVSACVARMPVRPVYRSLIPDDTSATLVNDVQNSEWEKDKHLRYRIESDTCASNSLVLLGNQIADKRT